MRRCLAVADDSRWGFVFEVRRKVRMTVSTDQLYATVCHYIVTDSVLEAVWNDVPTGFTDAHIV